MIKTLKGKLSLVYIGLVLLVALVGAAGLFNLFRLEKSVDDLMTANYKSIKMITNMSEAIERQDSAMLIYINVDRKKGMNLFAENSQSFMESYIIESDNITEKGEKELVSKINDQYSQYIKHFYQLQEIRNNQGEDPSVAFYDKTIMPVFSQIKQSLSNLIMINEKAMFTAKQNATQKAKDSMNFLLILSLIAVIGGYAAARHFVSLCLDQNYEVSTLGSLMKEKNKFRAIVKSIRNPLLILNSHFKIVLINNACEKFFNIEESKAIGNHFLEVIRNGEVFDLIIDVIDSEKEYSDKIINIKGSQDRWFYTIVTEVKDVDNEECEYIVVLQDVTELKELEKVKTDFVATISHEFKTPLTSIMMAASMLKEGQLGELNLEQTEAIDALKEDGEKLSDLVNDLLELSKIESGKAIYNIEPCYINAIIEASIKGFAEAAMKKEVALINEVYEELPPVNADFGKTGWVINNLISNALKYTSAGDFITINAKADNKYVYVSVKDTGTGIPPNYLEKIFDKFVQVKESDIEVRGTGLGLSAAKEIVNSQKGSIWVESELDKGSTFTFTLPVCREE